MMRLSLSLAVCLLLLALAAPLAGAAECGNEQLRRELGATALPDCRAYELVSPFPVRQRNSSDVFVNTQRSRAALSGDAFQFSMLGGTVDAQSSPFATDYVAVRHPGGWSAHGVTPAAGTIPLNFGVLGQGTTHYVGELAPDLSKGVVIVNRRINDEGENVKWLTNLYLRDDLLTPGAGHYRLLTDSFAPIPDPGEEFKFPVFAASTPDLSHILFESKYELTSDAVGLGELPKLYKWVDGEVRLEGILPESEGGAPTLSQAGQASSEPRYTFHTLSEDGSRSVFTAPPYNYSAGQLYLRDDHGTASVSDDDSVKVNVSEKANGAGPGGSDPAGPQPATFSDATPDLSQVFFTSAEALTDDAVEGLPQKLYRFQLDAPAGERLTLLSVDSNPGDGITDEGSGVIGTSTDGSYVYFLGANQLVAGGSTDWKARIYLWHDGTISQVAGVLPYELNWIVGTNGGMGEWGGAGKWSRVTPDGRHMIFIAQGSDELTGYDHGEACPEMYDPGCQEIYFYDATEDDLRCASCNPIGVPGISDADYWVHKVSFALGGEAHLNRSLSDDGRYVFFSTADSLAPEDRNEDFDAYAFDTASGFVELLSPGGAGGDAYFLDASGDGRDVFFATREQIVPGDDNDNIDVYDARVDGGLEGEPAPIEAPCASVEACRPQTTPASEETAPASRRFVRHRSHRKHRRKHRRRSGARKHRPAATKRRAHG